MRKIKLIFNTARKKLKPVWTAIIQWLTKVVKTVLHILLGLLITAATLGFFVVPFLNTLINKSLAQWIWYPSAALFFLALSIFCFKKKDPTNEPPVFDLLGKWGALAVAITFTSIFVFNFYCIDIIWKWVIFGAVVFYIPAFFFSLLVFDWKHIQRSDEEKQKASLNTFKNILLYWFFDLLYLSIFNNWLIATFVFGILALVIVALNLADAFLNGTKSLRFFIALELILGLIISAYLIFIIPNDTVQNIVLTIVAALLGGIFTLLGVAWTIKKGEADRQADMWRIEEERKEETRRKYTPYIMLVNGTTTGNVARVASTNDLDFNKPEDIDKIQDNTFYVVKIDYFTIRNVSNSNILLKGIYFNNIYHSFAFDTLVDKGGFCQIQVGINHWFASPQKITSITLLVTDILLNEYAIECQFHAKLDQLPQKEFAPNDMEYTVYPYVYNIESLSLPNYQHQT